VPGATVAAMSSSTEADKARYTYRLRISGVAQQSLLAEWDRCRWVWNQCVEASNTAHRESVETGVKVECGPAQMDKRLTGWRAEREWLSGGSSVAQQQTIRDFGRARAKALKDRMDSKLSPRRWRGMPKFKSKHRSVPTLNYSLRGFVLDGQVVKLAGGIVVRPVWSRELPAAPSSVRIYQTRWVGGGARSSWRGTNWSRYLRRGVASGSIGALLMWRPRPATTMTCRIANTAVWRRLG